ncbi:hypothetical protein YT1_1454 [Rhodococcus ruber]|nr:hypothetical protein YT1_1454 [Rhodococcus ruber]
MREWDAASGSGGRFRRVVPTAGRVSAVHEGAGSATADDGAAASAALPTATVSET